MLLLGTTVVPSNFSTFSKCFRAFLMFTRVAAEAITQWILLITHQRQSISLTDWWIGHNHHYVCVWCEWINKSGKRVIPNFHTLKLRLQFTIRNVHILVTCHCDTFSTDLQLNLNCLMMLLIFSNLCGSLWSFLSALAITCRENKTISLNISSYERLQIISNWIPGFIELQDLNFTGKTVCHWLFSNQS